MQEEPIHKDWVAADREFIAKVNGMLKTDPAHINKVLGQRSIREKSLGFEYGLTEGRDRKGYASYSYSYLFHGQDLVSYRISPPVAYDPRIRQSYIEMIRDVFPVTTNDGIQTVQRFKYNSGVGCSPLEGCPVKSAVSEKMAFFMSPFSDVTYGTRGGMVDSLLPNRRCYLEVKNQITPEICLMLLFSKNPATRLTAYEHYLRYRKKYYSISDAVEKRMAVVFKETPMIDTMHGCIGMQEDSATLVKQLAAEKETKLED